MLIPHIATVFQRDIPGGPLDANDRRVLRLVAEGESYEEAAALLRLDLSGIERAMARIRRYLGAVTDEHAVALALRARILD